MPSPHAQTPRAYSTAFALSREAFDSIYGDECVARLAPHGHVLGQPLDATELARGGPEWLRDVEVLFTGWGGPRLDAALLEKLPRLRPVFHGAGTLRSIVTDACWERGLVFSNAVAINAEPTGDFAFGAILLSFKRAWQQAALVRSQRGYPSPPLSVPTSSGAVVGLVSLGHVGRRVAGRLREFDITVLAYDPVAEPSLFDELRVVPASLEDIFTRADIISLHAPLLPETTGMIDATQLRRLKPDATLINTARGGLINEPDLIALLRQRPDVFAILDVTDPEPPSRDSALFDLPNVFLTPHIAGSSGPECRRMGRAMVEEFHRFVRGEPLLYPVTRDQFARNA